MRKSPIVDHYGNNFTSHSPEVNEVLRLRHEIRNLKSSYDATANGDALSNYWANSDRLSPNQANSFTVRSKLRSRSRYEVIENNSYLKGSVLTIVNDFVGSGPKLDVTDERLNREAPRDAPRFIERSWARWAKLTAYRQKLWQMCMAQIVDGEGFKIAYNDPALRHPIKLNYQIAEADRISSLGNFGFVVDGKDEVDGVRFDSHGVATQYHLLDDQPGGFFFSGEGEWIDAQFVDHWYRKDRPWLRGIPELTPSLPLCGLLRRYTLAVIKAAELAADFAVLLTTNMPANTGNPLGGEDDADDWTSFPVEQGMITAMPSGRDAKQIHSEQPIQVYDVYVHTLLMEITRPLMLPFNLAVGTSKDSNMASAIVDTHIYKGSQKERRMSGTEQVVDNDFDLWWEEFTMRPETREAPEMAGVFDENPSLQLEPPRHRWLWDAVGLVHTDPLKVAKARTEDRNNAFRLMRDIQEEDFDRTYEEWQDQFLIEKAWEEENGFVQPEAVTVGTDEERDEEE